MIAIARFTSRRLGPAGLAVLLLAWIGTAQAQSVVSPALEQQLDQLISHVLQAQQIPAITVAVAQADRVIYSKAFGMADLENSVPATTETVIRTGSIAKPITAVAAMTLVEAGKLSIDAPVQTYCAPFPVKQWPITTRELLGHTSGIRHYQAPELTDSESTHHYNWIADAFPIFAGDPLLFQPGTGFNYSTYGYSVVGCVIEGAAGEQF